MRVYIANVPYRATYDELREIAAPFAEVTTVTIPSGRDGRPTGFAFIGVATLAGQARLIQGLNGYSLGGRQLKAEAAHGHE